MNNTSITPKICSSKRKIDVVDEQRESSPIDTPRKKKKQLQEQVETDFGKSIPEKETKKEIKVLKTEIKVLVMPVTQSIFPKTHPLHSSQHNANTF